MKNDPPTPCGASQTDCPAGIGPPFEDYDQCGDSGQPTTYLTGDCYIDQMSSPFQTNRIGGTDTIGAGTIPSPPFPAGCLDTLAVPSGGFATDFVVVTGLPSGVGSNILEDSQCCDNIMNNIPYCDPADPDYVGGWNALCSSTAQAYAQDGGFGCLRPAGSSISNCFAPLGRAQVPQLVQPRINMLNVSAASQGILLINDGNVFLNQTASFQIIDADGDGCTDGNCTLSLFEDIGAGPVESLNILLTNAITLESLADTISAVGNGWGETDHTGGRRPPCKCTHPDCEYANL